MSLSLLLALAIIVSDVYAIVKILNSSAEVGRKYLWVFLICLLPMLGVILWLIKGPKN
ncbi:PLD nuclease N-terminal domain-containing protein [Agarivorans sp. MS3-6]|uniref:PLD nuclease N-terminal domain-containing protein n=1 Tax=Agarivorans sp. TSD2052 TaxID=2937286 RepID=UPI00200D6FDD|nr:PLD nuclease N-terminal domain-containing protein [Agarivorans sp. TSD2052]UPW18156.1 PLD nuclease N-terminal domain-containing protein [Agarivorans sp. TSD2052]